MKNQKSGSNPSSKSSQKRKSSQGSPVHSLSQNDAQQKHNQAVEAKSVESKEYDSESLKKQSQKNSSFTSHQNSSKNYEFSICQELRAMCDALKKSGDFDLIVQEGMKQHLDMNEVDYLNGIWKSIPLKQQDSKTIVPKFINQGATCEIDFIFSIELSNEAKKNTPLKSIAHATLANQYDIVFEVPSVNLFEVTLESSGKKIRDKIKQVLKNGLIVDCFSSRFFPMKFVSSSSSHHPINKYGSFKKGLFVISNNDLISGLVNFDQEYSSFIGNQKLQDLIQEMTARHKISYRAGERPQIAEILYERALKNFAIGHMAIDCVYSHTFTRLGNQVDSLKKDMEQRESKLYLEIVLLKKEVNRDISRLEASVNSDIGELKATINDLALKMNIFLGSQQLLDEQQNETLFSQVSRTKSFKKSPADIAIQKANQSQPFGHPAEKTPKKEFE